MALDELCLSAAAQELRRELLGARVDKVSQPARSEVVLAMRGRRENVKLLLCAEPGFARAQLTALSRENPAQPPVFCMLLRKHLAGARLTDIVQPQGERILRFLFRCVDELGDSVERSLILEAMGRGTNLILTDGEGRILASTRRVEGDLLQGKRQVLPGLFYRPPEPHPGVPPLLARELEFRGEADVDAGLERLRSEVAAGRYTPTLLLRDGAPFDFSFLPILHYGPQVENVAYPTFAALLDDFYSRREQTQRVRQRGGDLLKAVTALRERAQRKLLNQTRELEAARDREGLRLRGDLLTANLYRLQKGMACARVENYYDPDAPLLDIPLDPLLTPQQNAAKYYRSYAKAKTAEAVLTRQLAAGREELEYLDGVLETLSLAEGDRDLLEIRRELEEGGYLSRAKAGKKAMRTAPKPAEFRTSSGLRVSVGKNNTQNDLLTTRLAGKNDLWLHVQKLHGAHVILWTAGGEAGPEDILEAAGLAAWYSQGRDAPKVAVDYTPVRFVKKPAGAKPGMVVYTTYRTLLAQPRDPHRQTDGD